MRREKFRTASAIREAIDSYPDGLCLCDAGKRPILVNQTMNTLVERLTGHTVLDADAVWRELSGVEPLREGERLHQPWLEEGSDTIFFQFPEGTVWRFRWLPLTEGDLVQLEATEVTQLCHLSRELYDNNRRLWKLQSRQKVLLENIVQINRDKELLAAKIRIHDRMGHCLVATEQYLSNEAPPGGGEKLKVLWQDTIRGLTQLAGDEARGRPSPREELLQVAEMIGCQVVFQGNQPKETVSQRLLYAAVREALSNAVRHAGANQLTVSVHPSPGGYHAELSHNGRPPAGTIREGDGLRDLRRRLEAEGGSLTIRYRPGVCLELELPGQPGGEEGRI